ncbi:MAG: hypothetical protein U0599_16910 [Vicinamibacteria bacterium]
MAWPIVDGWVIPGDQYALYEAGRFNDTPILVGYNSDEGLSFTPRSRPRTSTPRACAPLRPLRGPPARGLPRRRRPRVEDGPRPGARLRVRLADVVLGAAWSAKGKEGLPLLLRPAPAARGGSPEEDHGSRRTASTSPYVFGNLEEMKPPATDSDRRISDAMAACWTNFAKRRSERTRPAGGRPAFGEQQPTVMVFRDRPKTGPVPSEASLRVLDQYFAWRRTPEGRGGAPFGVKP